MDPALAKMVILNSRVPLPSNDPVYRVIIYVL